MDFYCSPTAIGSGFESSYERRDASPPAEGVNDCRKSPPFAEEIESVAQDDGAEAATSYQKNVIIAALLEELCRTRAAEFLNNMPAGSRNTGTSVEVQALARKTFEHISTLMAWKNLLPPHFSGDDLQSTRRQCLAYIDDTGLQAIHEGADLQPEETHRHLLSQIQTNSPCRPSMPAPFHDEGDLLSRVRGMSLKQMPMPHLYRCRVDFSKAEFLGKGGFGKVYHVFNPLDQTHYAIKRIPLKLNLPPGRYIDQVNRLLREISTLARLEHPNVVRYYGAWLEEPGRPATAIMSPPTATTTPSTKLISDRSADILPRKHDESYLSDGIVFDYDSLPSAHPNVPKNATSSPQHVEQSSPTTSLQASDIFTDGDGQISQTAPIETSQEVEQPVVCVQMSLHCMNLATYLAPLPRDVVSPPSSPPSRHCFHVVPSLRLFLVILSGLQHIHALGIIHRDIKPGNILLSESDTVPPPNHYGYENVGCCSACSTSSPRYINPRIADFGLVAFLEHTVQENCLTKGAGTAIYQPPHNATQSETVTEKLDIFALGIVLFELLYHFDTGMERQEVLATLKSQSILPRSFVLKINRETKPKNPSSSVGTMLADCILGMLNHNRQARWCADKVRSCVENVLRGVDDVKEAS